MRNIALIGAPSSAGAYAPGQEMAPAAFRRHGLVQALGAHGRRVRDLGDVEGFRWRPDPTRPDAMNLRAVRQTAAAVAECVASAIHADELALVIGGDCTVELGTVAGALRDGATVGLVYVDLDADLNTPAESDGALDWTGVAHLLDLPGTAPELSALGERRPMLAPADVLHFGLANISPFEASVISGSQLEPIMLADVQADPASAAARAAEWADRYDRLLVHLDVDVLAFTDFPIAENTRRCDGLTFDQLAAALRILLQAPNLRALTITEVNPDHAPDEARSFRRLINALAAALSSR